MRVATWNINGLRARMDFVLHWLAARQPDIVGLQELKLDEDQFPTADFRAAGYEAAFSAQKGWNGVAVLSRQPIEVLAGGLPGQEDQGARLLTCATGGIVYTSVYVPNGKDVGHDDFAGKLTFLDALAEYLGGRADASGVVGGDFNLCPAAADSWNEAGFAGRIFHTREERSRFLSVLASGYHDLYRECHPDGHAFSWWDYRAGAFHKGHGLRIDFLLATDAVRAHVADVIIDRDYRKKKEGLTASDHAPVYAELDSV